MAGRSYVLYIFEAMLFHSSSPLYIFMAGSLVIFIFSKEVLFKVLTELMTYSICEFVPTPHVVCNTSRCQGKEVSRTAVNVYHFIYQQFINKDKAFCI